MISAVEDRLNLARELLQVARDEFARAEEAKGREAVISLRNACGKGWLAALEATNCYFLMQGVAEAEIPQNDRGRYYYAGLYMGRTLVRDYVYIRQTFHIHGYYEGIVEFDNMPRHFTELEEYIDAIEEFGRNESC